VRISTSDPNSKGRVIYRAARPGRGLVPKCGRCLVAAFAEILYEIKPAGITVMADAQQNLPDDELLALLPKIAAAGAQPERQVALLVSKARARGITWARIGTAMGMTRQAAWQRFSGEE
jgi:hypothetical protein